MLKRLLFLLPLLFIILNVLPLSLIKSNVQLSNSTVSPMGWQLIKKKTNQNNGYRPDSNIDPVKTSTTAAITNSQHTKGFPFEAYISKTTTSETASQSFSAWSWLWSTLDIAIILALIALAITINVERRESFHADQPDQPSRRRIPTPRQPAPQPQLSQQQQPGSIDYQLPQPVMPRQAPTTPSPNSQPPAGPGNNQ